MDRESDEKQYLLSKSPAERIEHHRFRYGYPIEELERRFLRVITPEDKTTIHNAFPDRKFKP